MRHIGNDLYKQTLTSKSYNAISKVVNTLSTGKAYPMVEVTNLDWSIEDLDEDVVDDFTFIVDVYMLSLDGKILTDEIFTNKKKH